MASKIDNITTPFQDLGKSPREQREQREQLVRWLGATSTDEQLDDSLRRRHLETCHWIFRTKEFQEWETTFGNPHVLWIHGPPAFGKTIVSACPIDYLRHKSSGPVAFFFCMSEDILTQDPYQILRSWITQIIQGEEGAVDAVGPMHEKHKDRSPTKTELWDIFQKVAAACPRGLSIIDGYDECLPRKS